MESVYCNLKVCIHWKVLRVSAHCDGSNIRIHGVLKLNYEKSRKLGPDPQWSSSLKRIYIRSIFTHEYATLWAPTEFWQSLIPHENSSLSVNSWNHDIFLLVLLDTMSRSNGRYRSSGSSSRFKGTPKFLTFNITALMDDTWVYLVYTKVSRRVTL